MSLAQLVSLVLSVPYCICVCTIARITYMLSNLNLHVSNRVLKACGVCRDCQFSSGPTWTQEEDCSSNSSSSSRFTSPASPSPSSAVCSGGVTDPITCGYCNLWLPRVHFYSHVRSWHIPRTYWCLLQTWRGHSTCLLERCTTVYRLHRAVLVL